MITRRRFMGVAGTAVGAAALESLFHPGALTAPAAAASPLPHFAAKAKRVIYLFMAGGPSHIDLWDYKPGLPKLHATELPKSVRGDQRVTGMTSGQASFPVVAPMNPFAQHGKCGRWVSGLLPHTAKIVDDIAVIKSVNTEAINHDPAITFIQTGVQQLGKPSIGSWLSYGLGSENKDLPAYIVFISLPSVNKPDQPLFARLWGSGFLPSDHQGVQLRAGADPVLWLGDPPGIDRDSRRRMLDGLATLNSIKAQECGDPEVLARIKQYEMAFRMQASVPELTDLSKEPAEVFELYGPEAKKPGTFAANCLLARRLAERGVRFIQLFHRGWDQHNNLPSGIRQQCRDTDQPAAALVADLKRRGMLDETLVVWGGEFGRTIYSQGTLTKDNHGRDHHGRCFTVWMAGGGVKGGVEFGETDDFSYNVVKDGVHIRDLNATILHTLGIDHERLTFKYQGLDQRLTGVEKARVVKEVLG